MNQKILAQQLENVLRNDGVPKRKIRLVEDLISWRRRKPWSPKQERLVHDLIKLCTIG